MKYSEFEREVEKLGFTHNTRCAEIVVKVHGRTVMGFQPIESILWTASGTTFNGIVAWVRGKTGRKRNETKNMGRRKSNRRIEKGL